MKVRADVCVDPFLVETKVISPGMLEKSVYEKLARALAEELLGILRQQAAPIVLHTGERNLVYETEIEVFTREEVRQKLSEVF